jgi:hypothetical protein
VAKPANTDVSQPPTEHSTSALDGAIGVETGTQNGRHGVHGQMLWQLTTKVGWGHTVFSAAAWFAGTCSLGLEANDFHILQA